MTNDEQTAAQEPMDEPTGAEEPQDEPAGAAQQSADRPDDEAENPGRVRTAEFRRLPLAEQVRRLREQFEDEDWRSRRACLYLGRTIAEDPTGEDYLAAAFPERAGRGKGLERSWRRAQEAIDASALGEVARPALVLLAAGGEFRVAMCIPEAGGCFLVSSRGSRTPAGAMRRVERALVRRLVAEHAPALADRLAAEAAAGEADAPMPAEPDAAAAAAMATQEGGE